MFLNVATFSVTNRSISSTKKKIDFFKTFLPALLMTTQQRTTDVVPRILGHPVYFSEYKLLVASGPYLKNTTNYSTPMTFSFTPDTNLI
jgi:hypothetical protein